MIEMIVVIFIISVGLVSILSLSTTNLRNQRQGANRLVASQLAREGVELSRNIRDTNWLKGNAWDAGLNGTTHCAVVDNNLVDLKFAGVDCTSPLISAAYRLYRNENVGASYGVYNGDTGQIGTTWYRRVILDPICLASGTESVITGTGTCANPSEKIGIQVTTETASLENPVPVRFVEQLYNWR